MTSFTVAIFQRKEGEQIQWQTLGLCEFTRYQSGQSEARLHSGMVDVLRSALQHARPKDQELFRLPRGLRLEQVRLDFSMDRTTSPTRFTGVVPLVLEPHITGEDSRGILVYHPLHQWATFPITDEAELAERANAFFRKEWAHLGESGFTRMLATPRDRLTSISFQAQPKRLLDELPSKTTGKRAVGASRGSERVLDKLGADQTQRAIDGKLAAGMPRQPYRGQLQQLLGGARMRPTIVVGPPGVGKSSILAQWIYDRLHDDGWAVHRNLDKVHHVWTIAGKRMIAGMSYLGDWEKRCIDLVRESRQRKAILWVEDLHLFGRLGQARQSERNFADFFRGPLQRGELVIVGECTAEQLQRLEDDAPSFAGLFVRVPVAPTTLAETQQMMLHLARELEPRARVVFHPFTYRTVVELAGSLFPAQAFPGKALDLVRRLADVPAAVTAPASKAAAKAGAGPGGADKAGGSGADDDSGAGDAPAPPLAPIRELEPADVIRALSQQTGLPEHLLSGDERLDAAEIEAAFARQVIGQREPVAAARDLVCRIRAGLTDPRRPYAVMLFTGPTGTGKTELATCIAAYLYGDPRRLIRFDMSEYAGPDAVPRLIGFRGAAEGLLTERAREQPFSVILLDEIEKAHPSVLNLLLQLFDEARLTDAAGNTASFHHTVIIMTSNLGARPQQPIGFGESAEAVLAEVAKAVRAFFPPELFNRIDRVVPFRPLTAAVAEEIATKELARLLGRRGLKDRNVFVYANQAVKERIVAEAFDPRFGARTVKRYLEDTIGSLLADELGRAERAAMQVCRIYDQQGALRLHRDPLIEAAVEDGRYLLEPLLELPARALVPHLPATAALLQQLDDSPVLEQLAQQARSLEGREALAFWYDALVARIDELRAWVAARLPGADRHDPEVAALEQFDRAEVNDASAISSWPARKVRVFDRRSIAGVRGSIRREELLAHLAEARLLARQLPRIVLADAHVAWIDLLRVGHADERKRGRAPAGAGPAWPGLLEWMVPALAAQHLEGFSVRWPDGRIVERRGHDPAALVGELLTCLTPRPEQVVLKLAGLFVHERFRGEHGCHIWRSPAAEPEIVRVAVRAGGQGMTPRAVVDAHLAQRAAFERALELGLSDVPDDPDRLLPAVRTLSFGAALRPGEAFPVELEDFHLGWSATLNVKSLAEALHQLWWLRWSRLADVIPNDEHRVP